MNSSDPTVHFSLALSADGQEKRAQFLAAWNECLNGDGEERSRPDIGAFLKDCPVAQRAALFRDLLNVEVLHRRKKGEKPTAEEYRERFPEMDEIIQTALSQEEPPHKLGRYRVIELLGEGAFGKVYRAFDDSPLQRDVAIKVAHKGRHSNTFLTEAKVLSQLNHPNIVPVYDFGETEDGDCFIVSKLIDGTDLAKRIAQKRPSPNKSAELVAQIADALNCARTKDLPSGYQAGQHTAGCIRHAVRR